MKAKRGGAESGAREGGGERTEEEESSAPEARWAVRGPSALPLPTRLPSPFRPARKSKNEKLRLSFCSSLAFHYLCP